MLRPALLLMVFLVGCHTHRVHWVDEPAAPRLLSPEERAIDTALAFFEEDGVLPPEHVALDVQTQHCSYRPTYGVPPPPCRKVDVTWIDRFHALTWSDVFATVSGRVYAVGEQEGARYEIRE